MKFIFIAGINRSGGSLLARLFDGHPKIASYPMEVAYPFCDNSFKIFNFRLSDKFRFFFLIESKITCLSEK